MSHVRPSCSRRRKIPDLILDLVDEQATKSAEPVVRQWLDWNLERLEEDLQLEEDLAGDRDDSLVSVVVASLRRIIRYIDDPEKRTDIIAHCEERVASLSARP